MKQSMRRKRSITIGVLCAILCVMAIGYSVFSSQLNITGTSNISSNWDVQITKIETKQNVGAVNKIEPTHTKNTATFNVGLTSPGDFIVYDITVSNLGSIDAVIGNIEVNSGNNSAIKFETSGLKKADTITHNTSKILTVKVSYDESVTSQPEVTTSDLTVTLDFEQQGVRDIKPDSAATILTKNVVTTGDGLYSDNTMDNRYVYKGANPNNYITFNDEEAGWRIVSIESDGAIQIIKNESVAQMQWNETYPGCYWDGCYWSTPTTINTYLNGEYFDNLNKTSKGNIVSHDFPIGRVAFMNSSEGFNDLNKQLEEESSEIWNGKAGMIVASDFLKANTNKEQCGTYELQQKNEELCSHTNYLINGQPYFSISGGYYYVYAIHTISVNISTPGDWSTVSGVRPVIYLSSDITLEGTGTELDPYNIKQRS